MFDFPRTKDEAQKHKYSTWAGNPNGFLFSPEHCAYEMFNNIPPKQCSRRPGYGPGNLYCKQHAKKVDR